jgi:hypothetical protein
MVPLVRIVKTAFRGPVMAARRSRAYKLKFSRNGIALFLDCHGRLCRLAGDLLSYGTTLRLSVTMLEAMPIGALVSELSGDALAGYAGKDIRFVGTSPSLAVQTAQLRERVVADRPGPAPQTWRLFLAALSAMRSAEDDAILEAYETMRANDDAIRLRRTRMSTG